MTAEQQKLVPQRDEDLKAGNYTVINSEATKNFNVYVVGEKHKEAMDYINILLDRSTDNVLGYGIKMGSQKKFGVSFWDEEDIPDVLTKLRVVYKNIMKLDYDNMRTRHSAEINGATDVKSKSPFEHFSDFYEQQNGQKMSKEQSDFMIDLIEQIWGSEK